MSCVLMSCVVQLYYMIIDLVDHNFYFLPSIVPSDAVDLLVIKCIYT